jgi:MFS family permease
MASIPLRQRVPDRNIWLVYAAIFILGLGYGISLSLVSLHLDARGFTKDDIGDLAIWFAGGIVAMSLPMGKLVRLFSARVMLIVSLVIYAAAVSLFPLASSFMTVALVRAVDGGFSVGIWICCETILLSRASKENKAFVTSLYAMAMASGYVVGPLLALVIVPATSMQTAFFISGGFAVASALLVLAKLDKDIPETQDPGPDAAAEPVAEDGSTPYRAKLAQPKKAEAGALDLLNRIKCSCLATFSYGYFQASAVLFLPLYLVEEKGVAKESTILVTASFAAGMLVFTNVFARYGDKYGHLGLMRVLAVSGTTMILGYIFLDSFAAMCVAVFIAGASLASISALSLALQGVVAKPHEYSRANAFYNVFYAFGMLLGPPISSRIFQQVSGVAMIAHFAVLWAVFIVFTTVFRKDDPRARSVPAAATTS